MKLDIKNIANLLFLPFIWVLSVFGISCSSELDEEVELPYDLRPHIIIMYAQGGLGDQGYNDLILSGVQKFKMNYYGEVAIYQYSPQNSEQAATLLCDWLRLKENNVPSLFIAASNEYETLVSESIKATPITPNKRLLLFESLNPKQLPVTTFSLSMYGASYLAGVSAASFTDMLGRDALILLADGGDTVIRMAEMGFRDGFKSKLSDAEVKTEYLADDWSGYASAQDVYQNMSEWSRKYGYIFPVIGGSNQGIFRYTREYTDSPLTAGMDVDQSGFSHNITGSLIKQIDHVVYNYMETWLTTGELPESKIYDLKSGLVDWKLSPSFSNYQMIVDEARADAIKKEEEVL